jgi:hypothetical protein
MTMLYRFAGQPYVYVSEWAGRPFATNARPVDLGGVKGWPRRRRRRRGVGEANFYESSAPPHKRYRPLVKAYRDHVRRVMREDLSGPPLRESGPEPLSPGEMPSWQVAYLEDPVAQPVGATPVMTGCTPGIVPCVAGTVWSSTLCRCVDPTKPEPRPMATTTSLPLPTTIPTIGGEATKAGFMGLSTNEKRFAIVGGLGLVGYLLWKKSRK